MHSYGSCVAWFFVELLTLGADDSLTGFCPNALAGSWKPIPYSGLPCQASIQGHVLSLTTA